MAGRPVPAARTTWSGSRRRPSARTSAGPAPRRRRVPSTNVTPPAAAGVAPARRGAHGCRPGGRPAPRCRRAARGSARAPGGGTRSRCGGARVEPERVLVGEQVVEAGAVGRIERDGQRAGRVVADGSPGGRLERGGEGGPLRGRPRAAARSARTRRTAPRSPGRACRPPPTKRRRARAPAPRPSPHDRCVTIPTHRPAR